MFFGITDFLYPPCQPSTDSQNNYSLFKITMRSSNSTVRKFLFATPLPMCPPVSLDSCPSVMVGMETVELRRRAMFTTLCRLRSVGFRSVEKKFWREFTRHGASSSSNSTRWFTNIT